MKYIAKYGMNAIQSNSCNAKQHFYDHGGDYIRIETRSGKFVCSATRWGDGTITVSTAEE